MRPSSSPWTNFFYVSNVYLAFAAIGHILCAHFVEKAELTTTIGEFKLELTHTLCLLYYTVSGGILAASVIGILAPATNNGGLWVIYSMMMAVLAGIELALAISAMGKVGNTDNVMVAMQEKMEAYVKEGTPVAKLWDKVHKKHKCCGAESYTNWQDVPFGRTTLRTPKSCCLPPNNVNVDCSLNVLPEHDQADTIVYTRGCLKPIIKPLDTKLAIMALYGMVIGLVNIIYIVLTCFLISSKKV